MLEIAVLSGGAMMLIIGLGLLFPWSLFRFSPSYHHLTGAFWAGLAMTIAFLEIWQIFWPVGTASFLILAAAGICGSLISWRKVRAWLGGCKWTLAFAFLAGAACLILFLSN